MTQDEFERLVEDSRAKHPFWFEGDREVPVTENELVVFELQAGCTLPAEYKYLAIRYGCGNFAFTNILSVRDGERSISNAQPYCPNSFLPVSDNGVGDYYGFLIEDGACKGGIYFADHEENFKVTVTEYGDLFEYVVEVGLKPTIPPVNE